MKLSTVLDINLKKVCPIIGVSIGREDDKATWRIDFDDSATEEQKQAAMNLVDAFVFDDAEKLRYKKLARNNQYEKDLTMVAALDMAQKTEPLLKMTDYLDRLEAKMKSK